MRSDRPDPAELLAAYADGIAELAPDERHRIEAALADAPALRGEQAQITSLLGRLRDLPGEGAEPDWAAMERSIRDAVGAEVPKPWWRRWTWLAPATTTLVTAMAVLIFVMWPRAQAIVEPQPRPAPVAEHRVPAPAPAEPADPVVGLWLDGAVVDVDVTAPDAANLLAEPTAVAALGEDEPADDSLLPAAGLAWVDHLDDAGLDRAERYLADAEPRTRRGTP
jgi:anti-sigma factor RsiW